MAYVPKLDPEDSGSEATRTHLAGANAPKGAQRVQLSWTTARGPESIVVDRRMVLGSAPTVDCVIGDHTVSRLHCEIDPRVDGVWVRDLDSRNGVRVNGVRVRDACLPPRATLGLGAVDITAVYDAERATPAPLWTETRFHRLIGQSVVMRQLFARLAKVAPSDAPVLISGETGTGKEGVARSIHDASPRASRPYVVVDCAALPEALLETELFGHTKGAFTGAAAGRSGAFEAANGGTIFLDEIGELPLSMQPKLLRVLESKTVRRVGESEHRPVDVRIVAATHRDLLGMVSRGEFREDLYFRLSVLLVQVPPLRDRLADVELLARHLIGEDGPLDPALSRDLASRTWRGNVRELRNVVERFKVFGPEEPSDITSPVPAAAPSVAAAGEAAAQAPAGAPPPPPPLPDVSLPFRAFREHWAEIGDRYYTDALLYRSGGNVTRAAVEAGIDRTYFYKVLRRLARSG